MRSLTLSLAAIGLLAGLASGCSEDQPTAVRGPAAALATPSPASDVEPAVAPVDTDGDGVADDLDFRPFDRKIARREDVDSDGDGVPNFEDDFPHDAEFTTDTDGDSVPDRLDAFPRDSRYSKDTDGDGHADSVDAFPQDAGKWKVTLAMQNALDSAEDYLQFSAFSRQGLIDQLSSSYGEGYLVADATWAVDQLHADWYEQAVQSAKEYLRFSSFSRQGLIDQLSSPYGEEFTVDQATYAVNQIGL